MGSSDIDLPSYVLYLAEFNVLICCTCQHGLTRGGVSRHFQRHHKWISNSIRKRLSSFASGLRVVNMDEIILPLVEIDAIEGLDVIEGFACWFFELAVPEMVNERDEGEGWGCGQEREGVVVEVPAGGQGDLKKRR
jgi:hypothetical protein